jgi:alpha-ketoglutarate-dependent taurine dioxygenase
MSSQGLGFHTDSADIVALFVLRTAKSGGRSLFCSSVAVADEIARTRPDLFEVLQQPFYHSWKGHEQPGEKPYYLQPVFSFEDGRFSSRWIATHIWSAQELEGVPPLTDAQNEAIKLLISLNDEPRFHTSMMFEPGDFQFLNNHVTYHARTEFEDWEEEDRKRHLLRLWLAPENSRPLNESMKEFYGDVRPGVERGGFPSHTDKLVFVTKATEV